MQRGRMVSLTKRTRADVVEPNQSRPVAPKTPANTHNLHNNIGKLSHQRPESRPAAQTIKLGKSSCVDADRVDCWAWTTAKLASEASIGNGCKPWAASTCGAGPRQWRHLEYLTDYVHRLALSSTASTNVVCQQRLETILSGCVAPLSDRTHEPGAS